MSKAPARVKRRKSAAIADVNRETTASKQATSRFGRRKQAGLDATSVLINRVGLGETTLALVAAEIGLNLKSLRYYFERREDLMVAAFLQSIALHRDLVAKAMDELTAEARVRRFVREYFALCARVARGEQAEFTHFGDIRALTEPHSHIVYEEYNQFFRAVRALLRLNAPTGGRLELNARTHMLISQLLWSVVWISDYAPEDFERVADRFSDILLNGLTTEAIDLRANVGSDLHVTGEADRSPQEAYLRSATALINEQGYRGASVERISANLNVTRGAFYHHYEAQEELVVACFERTFAVLRNAQSAAMTIDGTGMDRVASAAVNLVTRQMSIEGFMLRTAALTVVGPDLRAEMSRRMSRVTFRFADMLNDGMADGSVRICDIRIGSEMVTAMINSAVELSRWVPDARTDQVADLYVRPLLYGLFDTNGANLT